MARPARETTEQNRWEVTGWLAVFTGLIFLYPEVFGWAGWMRMTAVAAAFASTAVLLFIVSFVRGFIRDTWPAVHPELAGKVAVLQGGGWTVDPVHRWWDCYERRPHVHMTGTGGSHPLVLVWDGTTVLDERGNVIRHEP